MKLIKKLNKWANSHTCYPIDILRVALGAFLIFKGIYFFKNSGYLESLLTDIEFGGFSTLMLSIHIIGLLHFVGGIMIVFGLLTRLTLIVQLLIFIGAVAINFFGSMNTENLIQASIVLVVALFFIFFGSGKHSVDYDLKMES